MSEIQSQAIRCPQHQFSNAPLDSSLPPRPALARPSPTSPAVTTAHGQTFSECLAGSENSNCVQTIKELIQNIAGLLAGAGGSSVPVTPAPGTQSTASPVPVNQVPANNPPATSAPAQPTAPATPASGSLENTIRSVLTPDANGNVHEEELQHAIVTHLLAQASAAAKDAYTQAYAAARAQGQPVEDAVKTALAATVQAQKVTAAEAEQINGISFRAAQLDTDLTTLFDNKGGKNDPTIAVAPIDKAITVATAALDEIRSGKTAAPGRPLTARSNTVADAVAARGGSPANGASGSEGFLWKPVSDSNGKLVVLLPANLAGDVQSVGIYSGSPDAGGTLLDEGRFSSNANGGRDHYRFGKPGSAYPDGAYVVAQLSNGGTEVFQIGDSSERNG